MASVFFKGASELATLTNTFTVAGVATDPTAVSLTITDPTAVSTTYTYAATEITKTATGVYTKDIPCTIAGTWTYEWAGTGAASDVVAGTWDVKDTALGRLYCSVETLKSQFGDSRTTDDLEYHGACFAASRALEQYCQRVFYRTQSETRTLVPTYSTRLNLPMFHDLVSVSSLATGIGDGTFPTTWSSSDYQLLCDDNTPNINAGPEQKPYVKIDAVGSYSFPMLATGRKDRIQITGVWGWPSVPWAVRKAAEIVAAETFKLKDAPGMATAGYEDFDVNMLGAEARRRFAQFANPYRRYAYQAA